LPPPLLLRAPKSSNLFSAGERYLIKEAPSREMYIFTSELHDENQIYLSGWCVEERDETVLTLSRLTNFAFLINMSSTGKAETQKNNPRFAKKRN
jgi:hypothetical protein